jgi:alpha-glucosidase
MTDDWWRQAIGYQVYLPSFADSDGDGWGDLPGLVSRLDHLAWLGVNLLWVTPFYASPMHDHGYDISDHTAVDPRFGRLSDVDTLVAEAGRRGIRVIADLVVNHTSAAHPWFTASRASLDNPFRDYYLWRPGRGEHGELPPNNWVATFGGPAWTRDETTGEWYAHLFTPDQPDLNWANPKVADEVDAILRFWLDRGLAGFRVDTAHYLAKHPDLPDNPPLPPERVVVRGGAVPDWYRYDHRHDIGQPALRGIHRRWRTLVDDYDALLVGETHVLDPDVLAGYLEPQDGLHSTFFFGLVQDEPERAAELLRAAATATGHLSWTQSSHDWTRPVTRYGGGDPARLRALALTVLAAGLPGTLFLYQGEELGLSDGAVPPEAAQDPMVRIGSAHHASRDPVRTPMPWRPGPGLGFTTGTPWLPDGGRTPADTVELQRADPKSWLHRYRTLIHLVRELPALRGGPVEWLETPDKVVAYRRGNVVVAANLDQEPVDLALPTGHWDLRLSTLDSPGTRLAPSEAVILTGGA